MPVSMIRQTMFGGGEADIVTWKRTDIDAYMASAQSLLNMEVGTTMLARKCRGTLVQGNVTAYADPNSNIYEFIDINQVYYLVMTANTAIHIFKLNPFSHYQTISGTPYTSSELNSIDFAQDNDSLIFSIVNHPPARVYISDYNVPANPTFAYQVLNISPYPSYDFGNVQYNNYTVSYTISGSTLTFVITAGSGATGFTTDWIGGQIIGEGNDPSEPIGYANITNVVNSGSQTTFTATINIPFLASGYPTTGSQYSIRQPAWSSTLGFPAKVLYYQNRLWFAQTYKQPNTVFGSTINSPINFDVGIGLDTNAIVYTIAGSTGAILWLNGGKQLEIYTVKNEYVCPQDENTALTPGTFAVRQQATYGASPNVKPTTYVNDSYYVARTGKSIINFAFNGVGLSYTANNIAPQSSHLVKNPIARGLIQGDDITQDNFIYFLNPDNTLTTFQFATQYRTQYIQVSANYLLAALTPRDFNTNPNNPVGVIDIETINNTLYMLKEFELSEQFVIETMDINYRQDSCYNLTMASNGLVTGLTDLIGYTVDVLFEGQDFGEYVVDANGHIVVDNPLGLSGACVVGMLYNVQLTPMYIYAGQQMSNYFKTISRIYVDYANAIDFYINGQLVPYQFYANENMNGLFFQPVTDTAVINPVLGFNRFSTFNITQRAPFDLEILGIAYEVQANIV